MVPVVQSYYNLLFFCLLFLFLRDEVVCFVWVFVLLFWGFLFVCCCCLFFLCFFLGGCFCFLFLFFWLFLVVLGVLWGGLFLFSFFLVFALLVIVVSVKIITLIIDYNDYQ